MTSLARQTGSFAKSDLESEHLGIFGFSQRQGALVRDVQIAFQGVEKILLGLFRGLALRNAPGQGGDVGGKTAFGLSFQDRVDLHTPSVTACCLDFKLLS